MVKVNPDSNRRTSPVVYQALNCSGQLVATLCDWYSTGMVLAFEVTLFFAPSPGPLNASGGIL